MDHTNKIQEDLRRWHDLLLDACAKVTECYMLLPVAGKTAPEYRERVYCYELYHQLRIIVDERHLPYCLGGEIDKAGHPVIRGRGLDRAKPDLVVHVPGSMSNNLAVVEVKSAGTTAPKVADDIRKLTAFSTQCGYRSAYFLWYGGQESTFRKVLKKGVCPCKLHN
jgi:Holliday junction resolvase